MKKGSQHGKYDKGPTQEKNEKVQAERFAGLDLIMKGIYPKETPPTRPPQWRW